MTCPADPPGGGFQKAPEHFEQGAFAGSIATYYGQRFPACNADVDAIEREELVPPSCPLLGGKPANSPTTSRNPCNAPTAGDRQRRSASCSPCRRTSTGAEVNGAQLFMRPDQ